METSPLICEAFNSLLTELENREWVNWILDGLPDVKLLN